MTEAERLEAVKVLLDIPEIDTSRDREIQLYLTLAESEIVSWRYGLASGPEVTEVPAELEPTLLHAVVAGYNQGGAEGQSARSENGVSLTFKYADMVHYIHVHVRPYAGTIR